ncbi:S8 family serine peptidase [Paenibacillus alvei]|uniref:S8 family serine peptidase n=1 Tax=Paenibacillus alvei TaxID=44250 RepID=UPI0018CD7D9B|nr:S8 family serine peptidase [Paenibacillus alvei]MBG9735099.1 peptidase S8 [Paenibacillus alvei]MBG9743557.1 peptidase S8 [Paenibacillus alvei]MCY9579949.1 S8 family serine peptidase [Paenibacillus alvei]MCY9584125.1 S8 family serine peptidase [Paenibacillus alvei]
MKRLPRVVVTGTIIVLSSMLLLESSGMRQAISPMYEVSGLNGAAQHGWEAAAFVPTANLVINEQCDEEAASWIIKWKQGSQDDSILRRSIVESEQKSVGIMVVRPKESEQPDDWLRDAKRSNDIEYIEPNHTVHTLQSVVKPNDTLYSQQHYLQQIGIEAAWGRTRSNLSTTIALVDTGVDFNHPDLKPNLVKGINLLDSGIPQDDNGHGTSVAGVIAAVGNNSKGAAGIVWSAKIMPIKALDARGYGDEDKLGAGILYAVDHGAKIVVMSVGLYRYSKYMEEIVNYAEQKGVLLIAATGNDGTRYGEKIAVKYPAAYPTVLAIGGNNNHQRVEPRSNTGPEVDLVAPWHVFTTALGGGYAAEEGTSMAAPQVAGVAALLWSQYPELKPYQIRQHLRKTAKDIEAKGWDELSGYGMLRADQALLTPVEQDPFGTNTSREKARVFPIDTSLAAEINGKKKDNWFVVDAPYDGTLELNLQRIQGSSKIGITHFAGNNRTGKAYSNSSNKPLAVPVKKGKNVFRFYAEDAGAAIAYKLSSRFLIYEDPFEPNDKQFQAFALPARTQDIVGTFSHATDLDWYSIQLPTKATLRLKLNTDTVRIDPAMEIRGSHMDTRWVDEQKEGQAESIVLPDLPAGKYYILVQNAVTARPEAVAGEYKLHIDYVTQFTDSNEPNDKVYEAITMSEGTEYKGVFHEDTDVDWFQWNVKEQTYGRFRVVNVPSNRVVTMSVLSREQKVIASARNRLGETSLEIGTQLEPSTYYVRLTTSDKFDTQFYSLSVKAEPLVAGFRDIGQHWAKDSIVRAVKAGWINGYPEAEFGPDRPITRAEAASIMANAFKLSSKGKQSPSFKDVTSKHWAYSAVSRVTSAGIAGGVGGQRFAPDQKVKRSEMAVMIGNALHLKAGVISAPPFADVSVGHWAAPMLAEMKRNGYVRGYKGNTFEPNREATRAEFAAMLLVAMDKKT